MLPQRMKKAIADNPKKLANLIDLANLPSTVREFVGQSQISRLGRFVRVWSCIMSNNIQIEDLLSIRYFFDIASIRSIFADLTAPSEDGKSSTDGRF